MPHGSNVNAIALTRNRKWLLTGSQDGFIRKYDMTSSFRGEKLLTGSEKVGYADSISKVKKEGFPLLKGVQYH